MQDERKRIKIVTADDEVETADTQVDDPTSEDESGSQPSVEDLRAEIERLEAELAEERDRHLRAVADLQNYRRRTTREQQERQRYAGQSVLSAILPVMDNLKRVLQHQEQAGTDEFARGVEMTVEEFFRVLAGLGVTVIGSRGEPFDPNLHEAVATVDATEAAPGTVAAVDTPGYCLHDRCIRPARVVVAAEDS